MDEHEPVAGGVVDQSARKHSRSQRRRGRGDLSHPGASTVEFPEGRLGNRRVGVGHQFPVDMHLVHERTDESRKVGDVSPTDRDDDRHMDQITDPDQLPAQAELFAIR